uniref:Uncharacterized protein n=1 Tax=Panagrolaimus superbus TaxID=310955 RepID=A0A914YCW1_9BILA
MKCNLLFLVLLFLVAALFINNGNGKELSKNSNDTKPGAKYRELYPWTPEESGSCHCPKTGVCDRLSCVELEYLIDKPEKDEDANYPLRIQKNIMLTIVISCLCSGTALFFHWWNAYTVLFTNDAISNRHD